MEYNLIILLLCAIRKSSQMRSLNENECYSKNGSIRCCYNYEDIDGICTVCKEGTTMYSVDGPCLPCKKNMYGHRCGYVCHCNQSQRCDPEVGCIVKTIISTKHCTNTGNTEPVSFPNTTFSTKETTVIKSGTLISEWIILTLCITGFIILTGLGYLMYRKRLSFKSRIPNEEVILEPLEPSPYIGIYDEVDENQLSLNRIHLNFTSQEPHYETVDLVPLEEPSTTSSEHSDTGYLDPCSAMEDNEIHQLRYQTSQEECCSTTSSISYVEDKDNTAYDNPYQPLQENWQDGSHGYEVPVMIHKFVESSARFGEKSTSNLYYNVYKPRQEDFDMNCPTYENQKSPETKAGNDKTFVRDACSSEIATGNLHDYMNMHTESKISMNNCEEMESCMAFNEDNVKKIDQLSFSGDF